MVTPGKNYPGEKGFPTPNAPIETSACRTFLVPANDEWLGILMGAVLTLTRPFNWYKWGELTPDEAADAWNEIIAQVYANAPDSTCAINVPTPFWDDESDLGDEEPADMQPWYGEVTDPEAPPGELTFVESAGIWVITGFLAYSGNIGAAVYFNTIAPRFVLAWRAGDVGEIIRVVVDAADYGTVDTSSYSAGDIIEMDVVADPALMTHDIYLVKVE